MRRDRSRPGPAPPLFRQILPKRRAVRSENIGSTSRSIKSVHGQHFAMLIGLTDDIQGRAIVDRGGAQHEALALDRVHLACHGRGLRSVQIGAAAQETECRPGRDMNLLGLQIHRRLEQRLEMLAATERTETSQSVCQRLQGRNRRPGRRPSARCGPASACADARAPSRPRRSSIARYRACRLPSRHSRARRGSCADVLPRKASAFPRCRGASAFST